MSGINADVVVVGAGPSGVAASIGLVRRGAKVVLIEKEKFPRQKPCAGGVSESALRHLKYDITPVVREEVKDFRLALSYKNDCVVRSSKTIISMTKRIELDELGLNSALAEGCQLMVLDNIIGVDQDKDGVSLRYSGATIRAKYLVAADGAVEHHSTFHFGLARPALQAIDLELG